MIEWGSPNNFVWFWAVAACAAAFAFASWRKGSQLRRLGEAALLEKLIASYSPWKRLAKRLMLLAALSLIVTALAQPHFSKKERDVERRGIDVLIAVDVSNSMLAKDILPSRLEKAKLELSALIDRLRGDRIGVIAFAGEAFVQCPLTLDRGAVKLFLSTVNPGLISLQGTSLSRAIAVATKAFPAKDKNPKALILLTDGEDHEGQVLEAARRAKASGIRIFAIGIGTPEGRTIPIEMGPSASGIKKDRTGQVIVSKLDESTLKKLAAETQGAYFRSTRGELEVEAIARQLRKLAEKALHSERSVDYEENYQIFLVWAFVLLLLEMLLSERRPDRPRSGPPGAWRSSKTAVLLALAAPALCAFSFWSGVKNEEGNRHFRKGEIGKAKAAYLEAQKADPGVPEIAFNLGNAYHKEEAFKPSAENYRKAAETASLDPSLRARAYYNLGNTLAKGQDAEGAIRAYKQALRLDPADKDAKHNLELLLKQKGGQNKDEQKKQQPQPQPQQNKQDPQNKQDQKQDPKDQQGQGGQQNEQDKPQQGQQQKKDQPQDPQQQQGQQQKPEPQEGSQQQEQKQDPQQKDQQEQQKDPSQSSGQQDESEQDGQGASQGQQSQGEQEKQKQDQKTEAGQGQEPDQAREQGQEEEQEQQGSGQRQGEDQKEGEKEQQRQGGADGGDEKERPDETGEERQDQGGRDGEQKERPQGAQPEQGGEPGPGGEEQRELPVGRPGDEREGLVPKSDAQVRAEQMLDALENQEKQVLRMASEQSNARQRGIRRVNEKDW